MIEPRRVLVVVDVTQDSGATCQAAEAMVAPTTLLHVVALMPERDDAFELAEWPLVVHEPERCTYETIYETSRLPLLARQRDAELVILGPWGPPRSARARVLTMLELTRAGGAHVLSVGSACQRVTVTPQVVGLTLEGDRRAAPVAQELRAWVRPPRLVALAHEASPEHADALDVELRSVFPRAQVSVVPFRASPLGFADALEAAAAEHAVELLVVSVDELSGVAALMTALLSAQGIQDAPAPLLILRKRGAPAVPERLVASDTLWLDGARLAVELASPSGRIALPPEAGFEVVGRELMGPRPHDDGVVSIPTTWFPEGPPAVLGLQPVANSLEVAASRVCPQDRALVLVDAELPSAGLGELETLIHEADVVFVRMRPSEPLEALRARLGRELPWGGPVALLDAGAWLDDGGASDVPPRVDGQRLLRLGLRLELAGAPIAAVVVAGEPAPRSSRLTVLSVEKLRARSPTAPPLRARGDVATSRLDALTASTPVDGHRVNLELDNRQARLDTLAAIEQATERIHWQCYIVNDDEIAEQFLAAFRRASQRGVRVRLLVDALYSLHGAFGVTNPQLERLAALPGIEVHGAGPVTGLPSVADLKQRNHRKVVIIDGRRAIVSGRNLGAPYYTGPEDLTLTPQTPYHHVPWLDASLALEGPLVESVDRAFLEDWQATGGAPFEPRPCAPAGEATCRLVLHQGGYDTHTFDLHLELVESARHRLVLMNTFPLVFELQRSLVRAVRRGVRVQYLFGNVRPRWGDGQPFEGGAYRELADDLVRSRLEPVLSAGAEAWELVLPLEDPWSPALGRVFPHVHAKLLIRDEDAVAVGSANFDVTSAYWESEAVLVVHHQPVVRDALRQIELLLRHAQRVDVTSPLWRREAPRRAWLSQHWPPLVG